MARSEGSHGGTLAIFGIAILANLILTILLLDQVKSTRNDVADLAGELASKQDIAMLRPIRVNQILEKSCEGCHTDRRFAALIGMTGPQILATVERMRLLPGANIAAHEVEKIESALLVFRCTSCHSEAVVNKLVLMPLDERVRFLRTKVAMPGSGFRPDQIGELIEAFEVLARKRIAIAAPS